MKINSHHIIKYASSTDAIDCEGWLWMSNGSVPDSPTVAPSESTSTASVSQRGSFTSSSHRNRHSSHSKSYSAMQSSHLSKMANYARRWFVLKGNVLFYFHHKQSAQPTGFVLLEGLELKKVTFEFSLLSADVEGAQSPIADKSMNSALVDSESYYFIASSEEEMNSWCKLLKANTWSTMKQKQEQLVIKYKDCRKLLNECMEALKQYERASPVIKEDIGCNGLEEQAVGYFEDSTQEVQPEKEAIKKQEAMEGFVNQMKTLFDSEAAASTPGTSGSGRQNSFSASQWLKPLQYQKVAQLELPSSGPSTLQQSPLQSPFITQESRLSSIQPDTSSNLSSPSLLTQQLRTPPKSRESSPDRISMPTPAIPVNQKVVYRPVTSGSLDRPKSINISYQQSRFSSSSLHRGSVPDSLLQAGSMLKKLKQVTSPSSLKTSAMDPSQDIYLATFTVNLDNGYMVEELTKQYQKLKQKKKVSWTGKMFGSSSQSCNFRHFCGNESEHSIQPNDGMECFITVFEKKYTDRRVSGGSLLRPIQNWTTITSGKTEVSMVKDGKHVEFLVPIQISNKHSGEFRIEVSTPAVGTLKSNCFSFVEVQLKQLLQRPLANGPVVPSTDSALTSSMAVFATDYTESVVGSTKLQAGNIVGQLFVNMHPMSDFALVEPKSLFPQISVLQVGVQQLYILPTKNFDQVLLQEMLVESHYALYAASAYAQFCQKRESSIIHAIENVGLGYDSSVIQLLCTPDRSQRKEVTQGLESFHNELLEHYEEVLGSLLDRQSACDPSSFLRRSVEKKDLEVQWMALNCNLHEVLTHKDNEVEVLHSNGIVTVGAFTSHAIGFGASAKKQEVYDIPVQFQAFMDGQLTYENRMNQLKQNIDMEKQLSDLITEKLNQFQKSKGVDARTSKLNTEIWNCVQNWIQHIMDSLKVPELDQLSPQFSGMFDLDRQKDKLYTKVIPLVTERLKHYMDDKTQQKELHAAFHQGILFASTNYTRMMETLSFVLHEHALQQDCLAMTKNTCYSTLFQSWQAADQMRNQALLSRKRADACLSQALGALVTGFVRLVMTEYKNDSFWYNVEKYGYIAHFESLLSTQGDEMAMLNDSFKAVKALEKVKLRVHQNSGPNPVHTYNQYGFLIVSVQLPDYMYYELADCMVSSSGIHVYPVMFSQGINEMQALANLSGDTSLQETINVYGYHQYEKYMKSLEPNVLLEQLMNDLKVAVGKAEVADDKKRLSKRFKSLQTTILHLSEQVFRMLNLSTKCGFMHISCKSAKDRTSMAATLQHVLSMFDPGVQGFAGSTNFSSQTLQDDPLHKEYFHTLLSAMRSERGVRLHNIERNFDLCVGGERGEHGKYAFNGIQLQMLPPHYKPDVRVTNASLST